MNNMTRRRRHAADALGPFHDIATPARRKEALCTFIRAHGISALVQCDTGTICAWRGNEKARRWETCPTFREVREWLGLPVTYASALTDTMYYLDSCRIRADIAYRAREYLGTKPLRRTS